MLKRQAKARRSTRLGTLVLFIASLFFMAVAGEGTNSTVSTPLPAPPATDPDAELSLTHIITLSRAQAGIETNRLVRVRGMVLDQRIGESIVVRDGTGSIFAQTTISILVKPAEEVELIGTPAWDGNRVFLRNSSLRIVNAKPRVTSSAEIASAPTDLPVLTKAQEIRDLTPERAAWRYPVRLRAVVTFYSPGRWQFYVHDDTAGIYVIISTNTPRVEAGDLIDIEGHSDPGWFAPDILPTKITILGKGDMPKPREATLFQLATGELDSQWIEVRGVVRSVAFNNGMLKLNISDSDGTLLASIPSDKVASNLMDSVVRLRGVCASRFNNRRQIVGVFIWSPSLEHLEIEQPGLPDPFNLPEQSIASLSQFRPRGTFQHRTKVSGVVTLRQSDNSFFIQDQNDGLRIVTESPAEVNPGDHVIAAGYPSIADYGTVLKDSVIQITGRGAIPTPKTVSPAEPLDGQLHGTWVLMNARLLNVNELEGIPILTLQIGDTIFEGRCIQASERHDLPAPGSTLRLTGVYQVLTDESRTPHHFRLIVPSPAEIALIRRPPLLTFQHAFTALSIMGLIVALALLWGLMLRRKVQQQTRSLQESERMLRTVLDTIPQRVFWKDRNSVYVGCNQPLAEDCGFKDPAGLIGKTDFETLSAELAEIYQKDDRRVMETGEARLNYEEPQVRSDGTSGWLRTSKVPLRDRNGDVIGILGTYEDITERKRAEAALAEASGLLEALLDNSPDHIYFKDRESRFVRYSKSFAALLNLPENVTLRGKTDFDLFTEEHARGAFEDEQAIIQTGEPVIGKLEKETHADGRITWALTTKLPWRDKDGSIIGTYGISKDVTVIKETEAKLAYEQELLRTLFDNLPDAIYFKDRESRFVRIGRSKLERSRELVLKRFRAENPLHDTDHVPAYLTDLDQFAEYIKGKTDFDVYPEERARTAYQDEQEIIRTGNPVIGKPEYVKHMDGSVGWALTTKMPWRDANGNIIGTFGVSRDITPLKDAEFQLEQAHQRLLETSRLAGMAEVATDVLHNVGNVLNSVNVSCSLTIDRVKNLKLPSLAKVSSLLQENKNRLGEFFGTDARAQQVPAFLSALSEHLAGEQSDVLKELEQLLKHIDHIKQIVAMQQSYAKIAGVLESVSPAQLVEDALHINAAALTRHDVNVQCDFESTPSIQTEKHKVLQILVNLIRNAKYAMDESKRDDKQLTVKVGGDGNGCVRIQVIDNGVGIPRENLTRIFAHGFTTRRDGHGFGLHSSALAVRDLGGSLHAHSDGPGTGATFTLMLPISRQAESSHTA